MTETLIDVMSANKPVLLTFLDTLNTLATGHLKLIIRLIRELGNLYAELVGKLNVMWIRNPQRFVTHNSNKLKIKVYNYRCRPPIIMFLTFGRGFPFLRPPRRERPRGTARVREASVNEKKEVWDVELIDDAVTLGVEQSLFDGKIKWHLSCDNRINCGLDSNTVCEGKPKGDVATVDGIVGTSSEECFHEMSSRFELERL